MDTKKLKKEFRQADRCVRVISKDGNFRAAAIKNTNTTQTAQKQHNLSHIPAFFLGRAITGASLISSFLKGEERIILEAEGNGPISRVYAEALQLGETRGFINYDSERLEKEFQEIKDGFGVGLLKIKKVLYNRPEPQTGITHLQEGDIATDLVYYFMQSEQIPTAIILDVEFDENGNIYESAGLIVQAMPGADEESIEKVVLSLSEIDKLSNHLDENKNPQAILESVLPFEFDVLKSSRIDFFCRCSKEHFMEKMVTLNLNDIKEMKELGQNELVCRYCNSHYYLDDLDFDKLIEEIQAGNN